MQLRLGACFFMNYFRQLDLLLPFFLVMLLTVGASLGLSENVTFKSLIGELSSIASNAGPIQAPVYAPESVAPEPFPTTLAPMPEDFGQGEVASNDLTVSMPGDPLDLAPNERLFAFDFGSDRFGIVLPFDPQLMAFFRKAPHTFRYRGKAPENWRELFYQMFLSRSEDEHLVESILHHLGDLKPGATTDELAEMAIAFVQSAVTYDWKSLANIHTRKTRYPYQTLFDGTGVCSDKSLLLAKLLHELGYDVVGFTFEKANHMALGIRVPRGYGAYGTSYAFVESTAPAPIGRIPENYAGGIKLDKKATVLKLTADGKKVGTRVFQKIVANQAEEKRLAARYGKKHLFLSAQQRRVNVALTEVGLELDGLRAEFDGKGCSGSLPRQKYLACTELKNVINAKVEEYNMLAAEFNRLNKP